MKEWIRSFTSFTRNERYGIAGLCALLAVFIIIRATMWMWVPPPTEPDSERRLNEAWAAFKQANRAEPTDPLAEHEDGFYEGAAPLPAVINLNTADSATLVRLKGIGPVTAGKIVERRKRRGPFTDLAQLAEVGGFSPAALEVLKRHLVVDNPDRK